MLSSWQIQPMTAGALGSLLRPLRPRRSMSRSGQEMNSTGIA